MQGVKLTKLGMVVPTFCVDFSHILQTLPYNPKKDSNIYSHHLDEVHDHSTDADLVAFISACTTQSVQLANLEESQHHEEDSKVRLRKS